MIPRTGPSTAFLGPHPNEIPGYGGNPDFHNRMLGLADSHIFCSRFDRVVRH
jgi:hypothetical protein